jgi:serine/threonine protein kinase/formylglycine-generating enzyme required for sulfatase activity
VARGGYSSYRRYQEERRTLVHERDAERSPTPTIEQALLRTVGMTLGLPRGWQPSSAELEQVRAGLFASELDAEETASAAAVPPEEDRLAHLLTRRVRSALHAATETVARANGVALPTLVPEAEVVRGTHEATSTLERLRAGKTETFSPTHALIVADDEAHATLSAQRTAAGNAAGGPTIVRATLSAFAMQAAAALTAAEQRGTLKPEDPLVGQILDEKYLIKKRIGKGGFGTVYLAEDKGIGAPVAIKVLNERAARSAQALKSFTDEAKLLTTLDHPNIVKWITFDKTNEGLPYFVMEYVKGSQLDDILEQEQKLAPKRVAAILLQVVDALRVAHRQDLLHLDLKPNNVLVLERVGEHAPERIKVIDFGISQSVGAAAGPAPEASAPSAPVGGGLERSMSGTVTNESLARDRQKNVKRARGGTPLYASPEQCEHLAGKLDIRPLDARSDLYSLGVMAFKMLTGRYPFDEARTREEVFHNHIEVAPKKVAKVGIAVPRRLANFVDRCLQKKPEDRWADAESAYQELAEIVHPKTKVLPIVAALVVVFGGVLTWVLLNKKEPGPTVENLTAKDAQGGSLDSFYVHQESRDRQIQLPNWRQKIQLPPGAPAARPVLVDTEKERELEDWVAEWADAGESAVRIRWNPEHAPQGNREAVLFLKSGDVAIGKTAVITLRPIEPWEILEPRIESTTYTDRSKWIDPTDQRLLVALTRGVATNIRRVTLLLEGQEIERVDRADGDGVFQLQLGKLASPERREVNLRIVATDASGHSAERSESMKLSGVRIRMANPVVEKGSIPASILGSEYLIAPDCSIVLTCTQSGTVRVKVTRQRIDPGQKDTGEDFHRDYPVERNVQKRIPVTDLNLTADSPGFLGQISFELSDDDFVYPSLGFVPAPSAINVNFEPLLPELSARVGTNVLVPGGGWNYLAFPADGKLEVRIVRETTTQTLQIVGELAPEGMEPAERSSLPMDMDKDRNVMLPLVVSRPGPHRLRVRAFPLSNKEVGEHAVLEPEYLLFFEAKPPEITLELVPAPERLSVDMTPIVTSPETQIRMTIQTASPLEAAVSWELESKDGPQSGTLGTDQFHSLFDRTLPPREAQTTLTQWKPLFESGIRSDGTYSFKVTARNVAGASVQPLTWQLGYTKPFVKLQFPGISQANGKETWQLEQATWLVTATARDPNGIEEVRARVERKEGPALEFVLAYDPATETAHIEAPPAIGLDWSEVQAEIAVTAVDRAGISNTDRQGPFWMPRKDYSFPSVIVAEDPLDRMVFLRGNVGFDYFACGREDEELEDTTLRSVRIERDQLRPYYLDEHEVTEAQFRAFVEKDYMVAEHWHGGAPEQSRRDELWVRLENASRSQLPITSIDLAEASAYAHSRGKRLPTLLEWEFALRGDTYRVNPLGVSSTPADVNVRPPEEEGSARSPWDAVGVGRDRTQAPSFWNLGSNVSEWTWTPKEALSAEQLIDSRPPAPGAGYFWVVGASFQGGTYSFQSRRPGKASNRNYGDVGFRCALSALEARPLLEGRRYHESK